MRIAGWALAGAWVVLAGGAAAASFDAARTTRDVASRVDVEPAGPAQAAGRTPIVDGFDVNGKRLRIAIGQPVTVRVWSHIRPDHSYRLLPAEGVEQVGPVVLYTAPPGDGVGFTNAYDVTLRVNREGEAPIAIVSANDRTGAHDHPIVASQIRFHLIGFPAETAPRNVCEPPRYLDAVGDCVSPPPRD